MSYDDNIELRHKKKFQKYEPLSTSIKGNGWSVSLFAIEAGVRRYCSTKVKSCLSHLGIYGKLSHQAA